MKHQSKFECGGRMLIVEQGLGLVDALKYGKVDGLIIEGLWGFNDLGGFGRCIVEMHGVSEKGVRALCRELEVQDRITVVVVKPPHSSAKLKAIALVPTQKYACYQRYAAPFFGKPYRDFYYNVVYEALDLLVDAGCSDIAIAGITGSELHVGNPDIGNCVAEAVIHAALQSPALCSVCSVGNGPHILSGTDYLNAHPDKIGFHIPVAKTTSVADLVTRVTMELPVKSA